LSAPAPRTADGKPDLSGIWQPETTRRCPPEGCFDMLAGEQFFNIGWGLKDGLPYRAWAADARKVRMSENGKDDPVSHCLPDGAVMTERFRRVNYGTLEIEITVDDPKAYTAPWTVKVNQFIVLDTDLLDYVCLENEKDGKHLVGR